MIEVCRYFIDNSFQKGRAPANAALLQTVRRILLDSMECYRLIPFQIPPMKRGPKKGASKPLKDSRMHFVVRPCWMVTHWPTMNDVWRGHIRSVTFFVLESHGGCKGGLLLEQLNSLGKFGPVQGVDPCCRPPLLLVGRCRIKMHVERSDCGRFWKN